MLKKGTKLYSILKRKCPSCHEGEFFVSTPYDFKHIGRIHKKCSICAEEFSKEPGFYYGALYISYGLGVAISVVIFIPIFLFYPNPSALTYILFIAVSMVLLGPFLFALSKIIWANLFISFKSKK